VSASSCPPAKLYFLFPNFGFTFLPGAFDALYLRSLLVRMYTKKIFRVGLDDQLTTYTTSTSE
jgi:hypothetical protein